MFVARDYNGDLNVFRYKPIREKNHWKPDSSISWEWRPIGERSFPEVTWESEPKEIDDMYFNIRLW